MVHILIVDSDPVTPGTPAGASDPTRPGDIYAAALLACDGDLEITIVTPYGGAPLPGMGGFDGVVFTGSGVEWNTQDARAEPLAQAMRAAFAAGRPVLGSCNGMQLAASVLGGLCEASPNGREDGLAKDIRLTEAGRRHPLLAGREDGYAVPCVHRDEVVRLPEGAVLLAGNAHSPVQALAYERDGIRFWGMQYHPEFTLPFIGSRAGVWGGMPAAQSADLARADTDPGAARRLGVRFGDMRPEVRMTELRNWLAHLRGG